MCLTRTPRLPGLTASGYPRCGRPAGPVAKLAGQKTAGVGQRDRTTPGDPSSRGEILGEQGFEAARAGGEIVVQAGILELHMAPLSTLSRWREQTTTLRIAVSPAPTFRTSLRKRASSRSGGRGTFLLRGKKVPKETCPASPALRAEGSPEARPFARDKAINWSCETPR